MIPLYREHPSFLNKIGEIMYDTERSLTSEVHLLQGRVAPHRNHMARDFRIFVDTPWVWEGE